ncbi:hypothetical protein [Paenibacillus agaridevorans]|uniref:hypothetical protein n=1 Tax=Paenibacillus agaridevorans TaxID=171404 RepID=UPI001BE4782E|nr:hypothetical protein [Paenibacillus agaridevorans]
MSRSVKKSPVATDQKSPGSRWIKRQANKAVRRYRSGVANGKWYRKLFCPWNICDYRFYKTKQQAIHEWKESRYPRCRSKSQVEVINDWEKFYKRK